MANVASISGRLTFDPELKEGGGTNYCNICVAVDPMKKDGDASFIDCVAFGKRAESIAKWFSKGSVIEIVGQLNTSNYEVDGKKRKDTKIIIDRWHFGKGSPKGSSKGGKSESSDSAGAGKLPFEDDDIPF